MVLFFDELERINLDPKPETMVIDRMLPGIMKFNPILNWSSDHVKEYTEKFMLPINALYSRGYRSIGCAP